MVRTRKTHLAAFEESEGVGGAGPMWRLSPERTKVRWGIWSRCHTQLSNFSMIVGTRRPDGLVCLASSSKPCGPQSIGVFERKRC